MVEVVTDRYRLKQDGQIVARVDGPHALREIMRYATVYGQDGPVTIERARGKRWAVFGEVNPPEPSGAPHPNAP